jgi:hypothetical protein
LPIARRGEVWVPWTAATNSPAVSCMKAAPTPSTQASDQEGCISSLAY